MQEEMERVQEEMEAKTIEGKASGGAVTITVNGKKIKKCNSKKFTKSGKYKVKVTDKAGNTSTMIFSIKKK